MSGREAASAAAIAVQPAPRDLASLVALGIVRRDDTRSQQLRSVCSRKDPVSYQGSYYRVSEAVRLPEQAAAFCAWAEQMYDRRPPR